MGKPTRRKRGTKSRKSGTGSPRWLGWALAGAFVIIAVAAVLISSQSARPNSSTPTPAAVAVRPSPILGLPATSTVLAVNPAGQISTPAPQWERLTAPLSAPAGGWNLLVLHTNDTWGYLLPCG